MFLFLSLLLFNGQQDTEPHVDFVETVTLVRLPVKVQRRGSLYKNLKIEDVRIIENGINLEVKNISEVETPVTLHFLFDLSTSNDRHIISAKRAVRDLIQRMKTEDLAKISFFSSQYQPLTEYTNDRDSLLEKLTFLSPVGSTALYDSISQSLDELSRRAGTRFLVLLSDGHDLLSHEGEATLMTKVKNYKIPIMFVAFLDKNAKGDLLAAQINFMRRLVRESGGKVFSPGYDLARNLTRHLNQQRIRYVLSFSPPGADSLDQWRSLVVRIENCPECVLEYRRAYQINKL